MNAVHQRKVNNMNTLLLAELCACHGYDMDDKEIIEFIAAHLFDMGDVTVEEDTFGNLYAQKGLGPYPCFVSHVDTVHHTRPGISIRVKGDKMYAFGAKGTPQGVGGDDRCGVFIALEMVRKLDNVKAVFFRAEETGGKGSNEADMSFFKDCQFLAECDRKGNTGVVNNIYGTDMTGIDFDLAIEETMKRHGRLLVNGGFTDVMTLVENGLQCPAINVECGYHLPHTKQEYISIRDVNNTLMFLSDLVHSVGETEFDAPVNTYPRYGRSGGGYGTWGGHDIYVPKDVIDPYDYYGIKEEEVAGDDLSASYCTNKQQYVAEVDCDLCEYRFSCDDRSEQFKPYNYDTDSDTVCIYCGDLSYMIDGLQRQCMSCGEIFEVRQTIPF